MASIKVRYSGGTHRLSGTFGRPPARTMFSISCCHLTSVKGMSRMMISHMMIPKLYTSDARVGTWPLNTSGARHCDVPVLSVIFTKSRGASREIEKSVTFTVPSASGSSVSTSKFSGREFSDLRRVGCSTAL